MVRTIWGFSEVKTETLKKAYDLYCELESINMPVNVDMRAELEDELKERGEL